MIRVRLFAGLREAVGESYAELEGTTAGELLDSARRRWPQLAALIDVCAVVVDDDQVDESTPVAPGSSVAILPPVSGGL